MDISTAGGQLRCYAVELPDRTFGLVIDTGGRKCLIGQKGMVQLKQLCRVENHKVKKRREKSRMK